MPGASHISTGEPIDKRSVFKIVCGFLVVSPLFGFGILCVFLYEIFHEFAAMTWPGLIFRVAWGGVTSLVLMIGLPAVGLKELRRRRKLPADASTQQTIK